MTIGLQETKPGQAGSFYGEILTGDLAGLARFKPEDFHPCIGTILVVIPAKEEKIGSINLPDVAQREQGIARVAAVPRIPYLGRRGPEAGVSEPITDEQREAFVSDLKCPVCPGDWVVFLPGAALPLTLGGRDDLAILRYEDGPESEITGFIPKTALDGAETGP